MTAMAVAKAQREPRQVEALAAKCPNLSFDKMTVASFSLPFIDPSSEFRETTPHNDL
jgi:hypothetical protein